MAYYVVHRDDEYLEHFGVKGQKWGVRRYENLDGTLTAAGKKRYAKAEKIASREKISKEQIKSNAKKRAAFGAAVGSSVAQLVDRVDVKKQFGEATKPQFFDVKSTDDLAGYTNKDYDRYFVRSGEPWWSQRLVNNPTGRMELMPGHGTITGITTAFENNGSAFHFGERMAKSLLSAPAAGALIGAGAGALGSIAVDKIHNARIDKARKFVESYKSAYLKTANVEKARKQQVEAYKEAHPNSALNDKEIEAMLKNSDNWR